MKIFEIRNYKKIVYFSSSQNLNLLLFGPKLGLSTSEPTFMLLYKKCQVFNFSNSVICLKLGSSTSKPTCMLL